MAERHSRIGVTSGPEVSGGVAEEEGVRTGSVVEEAKAAVRGMADSQKGKVCSRLGGVAQALHDTARELEKQNIPAGRYANYAARQVDRVVDALKDRPVEDLVVDMEDFARRQPMLFVGGALVTGFMLARLARNTDRTQRSEAAGTVAGDIRQATADVVQSASAAASEAAGPLSTRDTP